MHLLVDMKWWNEGPYQLHTMKILREWRKIKTLKPSHNIGDFGLTPKYTWCNPRLRSFELGFYLTPTCKKVVDNVGETPTSFALLIMVFPIQRMSTIQNGIGIHHPLKRTVPRPRKTTIKHLRLERDGYSITITLFITNINSQKIWQIEILFISLIK